MGRVALFQGSDSEALSHLSHAKEGDEELEIEEVTLIDVEEDGEILALNGR
jgi:uncharacterized protein YuzE